MDVCNQPRQLQETDNKHCRAIGLANLNLQDGFSFERMKSEFVNIYNVKKQEKVHCARGNITAGKGGGRAVSSLPS